MRSNDMNTKSKETTTMLQRSLIATAISIAMASVVYAAEDQESRADAEQTRAQSEQTQRGTEGGAGAQIQVEEAEPRVRVEQEEPRITVEQPQPQVTVEQPQPQVQVTTPEPEVTVQQAQPQVEVVEQGQPQVEVEQTGDPQVQIQQTRQPDVDVVERRGTEQMQTQTAAPLNQQMASMRVDQIKDMEVFNRQGQSLGEVEQVVIDRNTNQPYVLVSVGGFLGIGQELVPLELNQMELRGEDQLIAPTSMTEEELQNRRNYDEAQYRELDDNQTLAEAGRVGGDEADFSALERERGQPQPQSQPQPQREGQGQRQ
jgi:hypothetical protein